MLIGYLCTQLQNQIIQTQNMKVMFQLHSYLYQAGTAYLIVIFFTR